jgi:hypothetical protein
MINVNLYIDDMLVGSGSLSYTDESSWGMWNKTVDKCTYTNICVNGICYSEAVEFCYTDKVTSWLPGSQQVQLTIPVYIDNVVVGEAQVTYTDTYGMNILVLIAVIVFVLFIMKSHRR